METERLYLRQIEEFDVKALKEVFSDFANSPYQYFDQPLSDNDITFMLHRPFFLVVETKDTHDIIGHMSWTLTPNYIEIGYCFHRQFHRQGYGSEALNGLINDLSKFCHMFVIGTALENIPSVKFLEKMGFKQYATEEKEFYEGHPFMGGWYYKEV